MYDYILNGAHVWHYCRVSKAHSVSRPEVGGYAAVKVQENVKVPQIVRIQADCFWGQPLLVLAQTEASLQTVFNRSGTAFECVNLPILNTYQASAIQWRQHENFWYAIIEILGHTRFFLNTHRQLFANLHPLINGPP